MDGFLRDGSGEGFVEKFDTLLEFFGLDFPENASPLLDQLGVVHGEEGLLLRQFDLKKKNKKSVQQTQRTSELEQFTLANVLIMSSFLRLDSSSSAIFFSRYLTLSCSFILANLLVLEPFLESPLLLEDILSYLFLLQEAANQYNLAN